MHEKTQEPTPDANNLHWGYIIGLTGAYLLLVEQLEKSGAIKRDVMLDGLTTLRDSLPDLPHAQSWLDITMKQIKGMEGGEK